MKNAKKLCAVLMCVVMLFSCIQMFAYASVATYNMNIRTSECSLTISGINSTSSASMVTNSSMSLKIKMELQKLKNGTYTTVATWSDSTTGTVLSMAKTRLINALSTYRLVVTFDAGNETVVRYAYPD
ncbi:MAG: hypothetical protein ACI4F5_06015 [Acutalibacteraceae bacterium]